MIIAGIGARATPMNILQVMEHTAMMLAMTGHTLRSGGAAGADTAFERGARVINPAAITVFPGHIGHYLAWQRIAAMFHPAWDRCDETARKLHARNTAIILGASPDTHPEPANAVLCWTENGAITGGTGQALRIATAYGIPIFNLAVTPVEAFNDWVAGHGK